MQNMWQVSERSSDDFKATTMHSKACRSQAKSSYLSISSKDYHTTKYWIHRDRTEIYNI